MKKYNNGEFRIKDIGQEYTVYGWVKKVRNMGGVVFVDLRDRSGFIQIVFNEENLGAMYESALKLKNEYCLKVRGKLVKRDKVNENVPTGEVEIMANSLEILSESDVLPFNLDDTEVSESLALKYRYLELRKESLQKNIMMRFQLTRAVRNYLSEKGFLEIETPVLCKSTPEGARDYIVPSRIEKGSFYALPQSPQIFKQLLMVGGFEKYFQIAKCFRDEDLRADRQPEFTQIDLEMSFSNDEDIMNTVEEMLKSVVKEVKGEIVPDFPRMTWEEAMNKYGSDKPDTRFEMVLNDLTLILKDSEMALFKEAIAKGEVAKCIIVKNSADKYSRKDIDNLGDFVKVYKAKGLAWLKYSDDLFSGSIAKSLEEEKLEAIKKEFGIQNNDLIFIIVGKLNVVNEALGALRLKLGKELELIDKEKLNFLWVVDFPMFEYSESEGRYKAMHHPFTMPKNIEDIDKPEKCLSVAYDIVLNGYELGGGSVRIHNPKTQKRVFDALGLTQEDIKNKFGFFIEAFKYGAPPHAGLAIGLERFTMLMCQTDNIRDVIAFPKTQNASDLMSEAPSVVAESQLKELGIKLDIERKEKNDE